MIVENILETIGNTPVLHIALRGGEVSLFIKLEMFNPTGSMKDRMALSMIRNLPHGEHGAPPEVVESSSGNTASGLSMISAVMGMKFTALMDHHASPDKINTVRALGGEVIVVGNPDGTLATGMRDSLAREMSLKEGVHWTEQHNNPANGDGYESLAAELLRDIGPSITHFVSAIGTGGSLCGTARALRRTLPALRVIGVEPAGSVVFGGSGHVYHQSGTGTPAGADVGLVIDYDVIDHGRKVNDGAAFSVCRYLARKHGLLVGGSTGGAVFEALRIARDAPRGSKIVTLACDSGTKYLDSIYNDEWLAARNIGLTNIDDDFEDVLADTMTAPNLVYRRPAVTVASATRNETARNSIVASA
jgi:cystathionine beta-synthase